MDQRKWLFFSGTTSTCGPISTFLDGIPPDPKGQPCIDETPSNLFELPECLKSEEVTIRVFLRIWA